MIEIKSTNKTKNTIANRDSNLLTLFFVAFILIVGILIVLGYYFSWAPIGVVEYSYKADGSLEAVKDVKTLWDWLDLLVAPALIALGIWWITRLDEKTKEFQEKQDKLNQKLREDQFKEEQKARSELDREIANNRQYQTNLESYFDRITNLILEWRLLESSENEAVRVIARTMTTVTLHSLDGRHKGRLVRFLAETNLINGSQPMMILSGADLQQIKLRKANLGNTNLIRVNLSNSILNQINLNNAYLIRCNLTKADLSHANMNHAKLDRANLSKSYLVEANLSHASLIKACFKNADLRKATLTSAKVNGADFTNADLRGTNLREVDLSGARLYEVKYDHTTIWPNGFNVTMVRQTPNN